MRTHDRDSAKRWVLVLGAVVALALSGCARSAAVNGVSGLRAPSMTDPDDFTTSFIDSPAYIEADPP
jgi:hypothetical protein